MTSKRPKNTPVFNSDSSGKEKDSETGYYYFGARYYNPDLSLWLSVDPMSDKYPSLSPYNYCAWNPMKLVDPDGDSVILSKSAQKIHNEYYNKNEEYTNVYNQLNNSKDNLFVIKELGDMSHVSNTTEGGTVDMFDEGYADFAGDAYYIEWGSPRSEYGGDETHVFLEELYHAKQILDCGNNVGTIEKEVRAKEFAIRIKPSITSTCKDGRGYSGFPTQLSIIGEGNFHESCVFLKEGRRGIRVTNSFGSTILGDIPGAYKDFPWR